jgi:N-acetylneuraminate synthase
MSLFLIAEIGINHNGDLGIVRELIDAAADAGFDAV